MPGTVYCEPKHDRDLRSAQLITRSGTPVSIRVVKKSDRPLLVDFFRHVSRDDLRFRFLTSLREVDADRLDSLCTVDPPRVITFLAFSGGLLAAVATVAGTADRSTAEIALATRAEWKRHGLSWMLFEHVIRYARREGFRELLSVEKADNVAAIQLEREMGFSLSLADDDAGEIVASRPAETY